MAQWYTFNGFPADPSDPSSYTLVGVQPTTCSGSNQICAIYASDSIFGPIITCDLKNTIIYALSTRSDIPWLVLLKS